MARATWATTGVTFDNSAGDPLDMSAYIRSINGIDIEALYDDCTPMGTEWEASDYAGFKTMAPIILAGCYNDEASVGPKVVFDSIGDTRTFKITYRSGKTTTVETIIQKYKEPIKLKGITSFEVTLQPTGTPVEA